MYNNAELRKDLSNFVQKCMRSDVEFTMKDICEACDLDYAKRNEVHRAYTVILNWRNAAQTLFSELDTDDLIEKHGTVDVAWASFLKKLNARGIFLLFSVRNDDGKSVYYQPNWYDKEMLDFIRMRKQLNGHITVLLEMDVYGEHFPAISGLQITPKELIRLLTHLIEQTNLQMGDGVQNPSEQISDGDN